MSTFLFVAICILLLGVSLFFILKSLLNVDSSKNASLEQERQAANIAHFEKQLADFETKFKNKELSEEEFNSYKLETERRLLKSTQSSQDLTSNLDDKSENKSPLVLLITICTVLPLASILLYLGLGSPLAVKDQATSAKPIVADQSAPATIQDAFKKIEDELRRDPESVDAKFALGNLYYANNQFEMARDVYKSLFAQLPDRPDVLIAYAEAEARTQNNFFKGLPLELIERVIQLNPTHKKANWLLGIAAFQENDTDEAISIWKEQLNRSDNTPQESQMLSNMLKQAGASSEKAVASSSKPETATSENKDFNQPHLTVSVSISPKLQGKYSESDSVFIYAKATNGPAVPLAIHRTTVSKLPLTLTLTDNDAMAPQFTLSKFDSVDVIARISKSGEAIRQPGDLINNQQPSVSPNDKVSITIDSVLP